MGEQGVKWQLSGCVEQCMSLQCAQVACTCHRDGPSSQEAGLPPLQAVQGWWWWWWWWWWCAPADGRQRPSTPLARTHGSSHRDRSVSRKTNQMVGEREGGPETMEPSRGLGQGQAWSQHLQPRDARGRHLVCLNRNGSGGISSHP